MKKKLKVKRIFLILGLIFIVLMLMLVIGAVKSINKKDIKVATIETNNQIEKDISKAVNDSVKESLRNMSEQKRIEYYASEFLKTLENGNYAKAYSMLNSEFKNNYFESKGDFEEYIKKYFPKMTSTNYENLERLGDIYVLLVDVKDVLSKDPNNFQFYIVIKENDYNNFELSFSVDRPMAKYSEEE